MATISLTADLDISLTAQEAVALRCTRAGVLMGVPVTPEQIADAFLQLTALEKSQMFNFLARKSFSLPEGGWDAAVDEVLRQGGLTPDAIDVINAPASHPSHAIRPGDTVRINNFCENAATRVSMAINSTAVVERLDRTGRKVIFSNGIALDVAHVTRL